MAEWSQNPTWNMSADINEGTQYRPADGVTYDDMNRIVENMMYLKKYGGRVNTLVIDAEVSGHKLKLKSEDV